MTHRVFIWRWQSKLTRWNFPENSLGHKILKALGVKRRTMHGHRILKGEKMLITRHEEGPGSTYTIVNDTLKRMLQFLLQSIRL